ncbi:MAG: hypothetical protein JXR10_02230 [Cyclobacteriaceae bacterium]
MVNNQLKENLNKFKRKHFLNLLFKGLLITFLFFGSIFIISGLLENYFWFNSSIRLSLLLGSLFLLGVVLFRHVVSPIIAIVNLEKTLSDEKAASIIGSHFNEISDKLINLVQLSKLVSSEQSLLSAALYQKSNELEGFRFSEAIDFKVNFKYFYYLLGLGIVVLSVLLFEPSALSEGPTRILKYNEEFVRPAPFSFQVESKLFAFQGESYEFKARIEGSSIPETVTILDGSLEYPVTLSGRSISYKIPSISRETHLTISSSGFKSPEYTIEVYSRPEIENFEVRVDYPDYIKTNAPQSLNSGSFIVPEGSSLTWNISSQHADSVSLTIKDQINYLQKSDNQVFTYNHHARESFDYDIKLANQHAKNKSRIAYEVTVIKDEYPKIDALLSLDSTNYSSIAITGNISDDYGFTKLNLNYKVNNQQGYQVKPIRISTNSNDQPFFIDWSLKDLGLQEKDEINFFVSVYDNDKINGYKRVDSEKFFYKKPSSEQIEKEIEQLSDQSQSNMKSSLKDSKSINKQIEELELKLKNDQKLDWQEEKMLEKLIKDRQKLEEQIEELNKQSEMLNQSRKEFNKQSPELQEKAKKLQELINEVLDEETKKLYAELQELLKKEASTDEVLQQLNKIQSNEKNLEKELERALELFKRMKMETLLDQAAQKLDKLGDKQKELGSDESKEAEDKATDQDQINEEFEKISEEIDEAQEINEDLKSPAPMDDLASEKDEIEKDLEELSEELTPDSQEDSESRPNENKKSRSDQKMKNAGQKMKKMAEKMMQMQASAEMEMMEENMDNLRNILDNLIKLSFEQEEILTNIKAVSQLDPRFIELSQEQLNLTDNIGVIEDSLLALVSRVVQISSFVTREVNAINEHLDNAMFQLRERNKGRATSDQQFAMTSMNNLALLLEDVLEQMQMSMSEAMGKPQKGNKKGQSMPSMSELQKQLSQQIQDLKKSGKSGKSLSEELAKLAAEQAELRRALEEMNDQLGNQPNPDGEGNGGEAGSKLKEAIQKMEENEVDLVNKRLTQQLIDRQEQILTRMLEAEESLRKQKESPERKGETANPNVRKFPPEIEKYLKAKENEIELLKTIPLDLKPFYKKEVNDYFRRISLPNE